MDIWKTHLDIYVFSLWWYVTNWPAGLNILVYLWIKDSKREMIIHKNEQEDGIHVGYNIFALWKRKSTVINNGNMKIAFMSMSYLIF